ncbi:MAG: GNAT family N-acetyltransferase, partial [Candidatus Methanomethylophilaceae archaeon]|nr:GNAT family N-acetyltransferase [Candidatus Methanomethylophilaceae archaeon]
MKLIQRYQAGKLNEDGYYWTNTGTFSPAALDEGFAFTNIPSLRFNTYTECLEDAATYVAYLNIGKDRPQDILDMQLIGYAEPTSMGEAYEIVGSREIMNVVALGEAASYATYEKNHEQKGSMKLSDLKMVDVTKEYLRKHGKKGALRDAGPCNEYCKTVAWELDGKPIVSVAVGYPNPKEREPGDTYNWIGNLLVDPEYRSYGLGKQAMEYAIKKLGGDALAVRSNNELAIDMYKKRGFRTSKDSARAVANKHADYYQMYLHEDIGTSVGELNEAIVDGTSYFKKMTGPGGEYIKVHEDLNPDNITGPISIKAGDIIDEIIHIDPSIIDIDDFSGVKDAADLVDYVKSVMKKVSDSVPEDEIYDTSSRGYVAGISLLMRLARRFPGKGLGAINNKTIDGLIPNFDSIEEFNAWKSRRINEWYNVISLLIKAHNINAQIISESIVPSVLSNRSKGLEALTKAGYVDTFDRGGVAIYDFKNFGGGKVYLNTNSFS